MQRNAENNMNALNNALIEFPITQNRKPSSCFARLEDNGWERRITEWRPQQRRAGGGGGVTEGVNSK